jgi:hypothetical protein
LWALLFYHPPAVAGTQLKIVVRMTGSGPFHIKALGPDGPHASGNIWLEVVKGP